jgi:hypothetical protein
MSGIARTVTLRRWEPREHDNMIVLFTDFGLHGPYTGQVQAVLHQMAPGVPAIDLFADAPVGNQFEQFFFDLFHYFLIGHFKSRLRRVE